MAKRCGRSERNDITSLSTESERVEVPLEECWDRRGPLKELRSQNCAGEWDTLGPREGHPQMSYSEWHTECGKLKLLEKQPMQEGCLRPSLSPPMQEIHLPQEAPSWSQGPERGIPITGVRKSRAEEPVETNIVTSLLIHYSSPHFA